MNKPLRAVPHALLLLLTAACGSKQELPGAAGGSVKKDATLREQIESMQDASGALEAPVVKLRNGPILDERSITGELVPQKAVIVSPLMDGRITFLRKIKVGDHVTAGEVVAKIDDRDIEAKIKKQEQQLKISDEKLKLDKEDLKQNQKNLEFDAQLVKEGYLNQNEFDKSQLQLKQAEVALEQSKLSMEQDQVELESLSRDREKVHIVSPIDGMVVMPEHLKPDQKTSDLLNEDILSLEDTLVGSSTPIFGVVSDKGYLAQCLVNGKDKSRLKVGQRARVVVIGDTPIETGGEIASIALLQQTDSHAYKVWIKLDKNDPGYNSGLFVRANIELNRHDSVLGVPKEYVKERNQRSYVQLVNDGVVKDAYVETGISSADSVELVSGVKAGDMVIASKDIFMADQKVNPVQVKDKLDVVASLEPESGALPFQLYGNQNGNNSKLVYSLDADTTGTRVTLLLGAQPQWGSLTKGQVTVNKSRPVDFDLPERGKVRGPVSVDVPAGLLSPGANVFEFHSDGNGGVLIKTATLQLAQAEGQ